MSLREYCGGAKGAASGHCDGNLVVLWSFWWHCGHSDGTDYGGTVVIVVVLWSYLWWNFGECQAPHRPGALVSASRGDVVAQW